MSQRGVTLLEMMVTLLLMSVVIGGIVVFLGTHSRMAAGTFDRTDIQRSGRGTLTVLEDKIGAAGSGLPKTLAIKAYVDDDAATTNACPGSPRLEVAALNFMQQRDVAGTTGTDAAGTINLAVATNGLPPNPNPGGISGDVAIPANQWLFLYTTASVDLVNSFGADRGHGMVMTGATRAIGGTTVNIASTEYSAAQLTLDLANTSELNNITSRDSVLMMADVSSFGMLCPPNGPPYLYWQDNGQAPTPLASNVATLATVGEVGLSFRFLLDLTGPDGIPDGVGETWDTPPLVIDPDPLTGEQDNVTAVEVSVVLRSARPDPQLDEYRVETFSMLIQTPNIHTRVSRSDPAQLGRYFFVENKGI